jgi:PAT family beta-lactamase induction signal transducer AmpG
MLVAQIGLVLSIGALGYIDPLHETALVAVFASVIAFLSATQDVAIDAYRREILPDEELGIGNAIHVQAYRIASLVPGVVVTDPR